MLHTSIDILQLYGDWGVVLFFIALTLLLVFTNQLTFLFPPSVHTVLNYMCVCVCVWAGEGNGLLLCSVTTVVTVPSKKCLEMLNQYRHSGGCEGCITELQQAVYTVHLQSDLLELDQLVKLFIFACQISWLIMVILRLYIDQIKFSPLVIRAISLCAFQYYP